jgi:hypothetical protein
LGNVSRETFSLQHIIRNNNFQDYPQGWPGKIPHFDLFFNAAERPPAAP